jgi:iron(III) transport system substrate-binding protein
MRFFAALLTALVMGGAVSVAEEGLCPNPKQMQGFRTCADVEKAEQEGEVVIYATNPEQAELKVLARFSEMFPKIKPTYLRLQAGALMAKVQSERQAQTYLVDAMQVSDMGMILDFQKKNGYSRYLSPEMSAINKAYKSEPEGYWVWGAIGPAGIAYNPTTFRRMKRPRRGSKCSTRNGPGP